MIPNTTQVPNVILRVLMKDLRDTELRILLYIVTCTLGWIENPLTKTRKEKDWISYSQLKLITGRQNEAISTALKGLEQKQLIQILDKNGYLLKSIEERRGKKLFYRLNTTMIINPASTSPEIEQVGYPITSNLTGNRSSKSEHTKEIYTKVLSNKLDNRRILKEPSCPLLNGSPLKGKYPGGHEECREYFGSVQQRRGFNFISPAKQFRFIHAILKAGMDFDSMNKALPKLEKRYGVGNWDFSNMAAWLEKGAAN